MTAESPGLLDQNARRRDARPALRETAPAERAVETPVEPVTQVTEPAAAAATPTDSSDYSEFMRPSDDSADRHS